MIAAMHQDSDHLIHGLASATPRDVLLKQLPQRVLAIETGKSDARKERTGRVEESSGQLSRRRFGRRRL
jgi:hypothetical protein